MNKSLKASTAADILAYFPHALGFEPRESFGLMTLHGHQIGATLRVDIPHENVSPAAFARTVSGYLRSDVKADGALFLAYTNEPAADTTNPDAKPHTDYAYAIEAELENAGLPIRDGWLITDKGWTTYFCEEAGCCMLNPTSEIEDSAMSAHMVYAGSAKRTELAEDPACIGGDDAHRKLTEAAARHEVIDPLDFSEPAMCEARAGWHEAVGTRPDEEAAIELVSYLIHKQLRDRVMADTISTADDAGIYRNVLMGKYDARPDWSRVDATEALLIDLLAYTPSEDRAPLFTFLGWLAWYKGKNSVGAAYLTKALESDPSYRLAQLLEDMITMGIIADACIDPSTAYKARTGN